MHDLLRGDVQAAAGKHRQPSARIIDSQSVNTTAKGGSVALTGTSRSTGASGTSLHQLEGCGSTEALRASADGSPPAPGVPRSGPHGARPVQGAASASMPRTRASAPPKVTARRPRLSCSRVDSCAPAPVAASIAAPTRPPAAPGAGGGFSLGGLELLYDGHAVQQTGEAHKRPSGRLCQYRGMIVG
jgi:hypothetical protein